ncbi:phage antirepressor KilAC domain-containing protein [Paraclostridium sordellii]|uniref:phage antirepressor KilAC domain-containing protein n=1 Tax=Paraclostridium sordellii TaxID=1505 RepID=UPI0022E3C503|nr:phage antirepressor KilAC domain-containing protein [Paeniclostridium sordellii]
MFSILDKREILGKEVLTFGDIENPIFLAKDVANWIGYDPSSVNKMLNTIDEDEKLIGKTFRLGQIREMWFLTEDGLYEVLMQSRKAIAKQFKKEVKKMIKQVRKTGGYIPINEEEDETAILAKAVMIAQKTIEKKDELLKAKTRELEVRNKFINQISSSQNTLLVREVAKVISSKNSGIVIGEKKLYQKLRDWGLILKYKNEPKQEYVNQGIFELTEGIRNTSAGTFTYQTMRVTGKGQEYILNRLLRENSSMEVMN